MLSHRVRRIVWRLLLAVAILVFGLWAWVQLVLDHEQRLARPPVALGDTTVSPQPALSASSGDLVTIRDPIKAFVKFVAAQGDRIGMDRQVTSRAVVRLAQAIRVLIDANDLNNLDVRVALLDLDARGRALAQVGTDRLIHADIAREAFVWASNLLATVQEQQEPTNTALASHIGQVEADARAIRADAPLSEQHQAVLAFFDDAAGAVQSLAHGKSHEQVVPSGT